MEAAPNSPHTSRPASAHELVEGITNLVSLPEACIRVNDMIDDARYSAADIGDVISADPALTARLLRVVNSSFYGFPSKIDTISRAITIIGVRDLRDLVLATSAVDIFARVPNELVDMGTFWRHNVYAGVVARMIAQKCNVLHSERLFVAGLLHDIGSLVLYSQVPELARDALLIAGGDPDAVWEAEQEVMGFDHAATGQELMRQWGLPESLQAVVGFHHQPEKAEDNALDAAIVHIANCAANRIDNEMSDEGDGGQNQCSDLVCDSIWQLTGLSPDAVTPLLGDAYAVFAEACAVLLPSQYRMP